MANFERVTAGAADSFVKFEHQVSAAEFAAKQITLPSVPDEPTEVCVSVACMIEQRYNVDYIVTGDILDWSGRGLESIIEQNDVLIIKYFAS